MAVAASSRPRVSVDGKFFRLGEKKFYVKGLAYGPFAPNAAGHCFASPEQTGADLAQIRDAGRQPHPRLSRAGQMVSRPGRRARAQGARGHPLEQAPLLPRLARQSRPRPARPCAGPCSPVPAIRRSLPSASPTKFRPTSCAGAARRRSPTSSTSWCTRPSALTRSACAPSRIIRPPSICARRAWTSSASTSICTSSSRSGITWRACKCWPMPSRSLLGEFGMDSPREGEARQAQTLDWQIEVGLSRRPGGRGRLQLHRRLVARRALD